MAVTLDPATEQRIQRKIEQGHFRDSAEVIARALDLLDDEQELAQQARAALDARLERSMAQIARGEGIPGERLMQALTELRAARLSQP
jgi:Arc/MetJ-type ribon-helix-helix transcriptional regulator